jgi:hypothetical protein
MPERRNCCIYCDICALDPPQLSRSRNLAESGDDRQPYLAVRLPDAAENPLHVQRSVSATDRPKIQLLADLRQSSNKKREITASESVSQVASRTRIAVCPCDKLLQTNSAGTLRFSSCRRPFSHRHPTACQWPSAAARCACHDSRLFGSVRERLGSR